MSLALFVDVDGSTTADNRISAAVGGLMTTVLLLAAWERLQDGVAPGHWLLPLICAFACAGWCVLTCRRNRRRPGVRLQVMQDGRLRLSALDGGESVDAVLVRGWSLGRLIWLHLRPASKVDLAAAATDRRESSFFPGSADCRFLLTRNSFDEGRWHALRRWLVWHRRSRRIEVVAP